MKHKLRNRLYLTYILFLAASFGAAFWLTPKLTYHYLHAVSQAEEYQCGGSADGRPGKAVKNV